METFGRRGLFEPVLPEATGEFRSRRDHQKTVGGPLYEREKSTWSGENAGFKDEIKSGVASERKKNQRPKHETIKLE